MLDNAFSTRVDARGGLVQNRDTEISQDGADDSGQQADKGAGGPEPIVPEVVEGASQKFQETQDQPGPAAPSISKSTKSSINIGRGTGRWPWCQMANC